MPELEPGMVENLEAEWLVDGTPAAMTGATLTLREFSTGTARYWTGSAWTPAETSQPLPAGPHPLTIPASWEGLSVEAIRSLPGYPDQVESLVIRTLDVTVSAPPHIDSGP